MTDLCGFLLDGRNPAKFVFLRENCNDLKNSLNAGVSCRKDRGRSNEGEQIHQVRDRLSIELLHRLD